MSRPGLSFPASNGRIAWLVASAAVALILAIPPAAQAQTGRPMRPSGATPNTGGGSSWRSPQFDIMDYRDAIANSMVVAPAPHAPQPLTSSEIVCLAGCDRGPGSVVYRDQPVPTLAKLSDPVLSPTVAPRDVAAAASPLSCIAGCYEPPRVRTVASLRQQRAAPTPVRVASRPKPATVTDAPAFAAESQPAVTDGAEPTVRMRSAFSAPDATPAVRTWPAKPRARGSARAKVNAKRGHDYGKVVPVPPQRLQPVPQVAKATPGDPVSPLPVAAREDQMPLRDTPQASESHPAPAPVNAPVTRFSAAKRPEPTAAAKNDWFNRINRERQAKDAAQKPADKVFDATAD